MKEGEDGVIEAGISPPNSVATLHAVGVAEEEEESEVEQRRVGRTGRGPPGVRSRHCRRSRRHGQRFTVGLTD